MRPAKVRAAQKIVKELGYSTLPISFTAAARVAAETCIRAAD
jgi:hypothetical protein